MTDAIVMALRQALARSGSSCSVTVRISSISGSPERLARRLWRPVGRLRLGLPWELVPPVVRGPAAVTVRPPLVCWGHILGSHDPSMPRSDPLTAEPAEVRRAAPPAALDRRVVLPTATRQPPHHRAQGGSVRREIPPRGQRRRARRPRRWSPRSPHGGLRRHSELTTALARTAEQHRSSAPRRANPHLRGWPRCTSPPSIDSPHRSRRSSRA
jgi:hypothetical protein